MNFKELHETETPLLLGNVWDVPSALIAEEIGLKAIGTSSASIANMLGYEDGENMSFKELFYIVKRIIKNTTLPLSVDIESGYSRNVSEIIKHIKQLADIGVVGINIEDSVVKKTRKFIHEDEFSSILSKITSTLLKDTYEMFINVRTDAYFLNPDSPFEEATTRIKKYEQTGINGIFIPGITNEKQIKKLTDHTALPVNVMCFNGLPSFDRLKEIGVKRISMGNFTHVKMYENYKNLLKTILSENTFESIF